MCFLVEKSKCPAHVFTISLIYEVVHTVFHSIGEGMRAKTQWDQTVDYFCRAGDVRVRWRKYSTCSVYCIWPHEMKGREMNECHRSSNLISRPARRSGRHWYEAHVDVALCSGVNFCSSWSLNVGFRGFCSAGMTVNPLQMQRGLNTFPPVQKNYGGNAHVLLKSIGFSPKAQP